MHKIAIKPEWTISDANGHFLSPKLLHLLADVAESGSLSKSSQSTGYSYRHAWNLIKQGEQQIGMKLLVMDKGKGSELTPLAEKLVWAGRRINARLGPMLETLASELESDLANILDPKLTTLRIHASHGFAIEKLIDALVLDGYPTERKYVATQEAVMSLVQGRCDVAGFHIPIGEHETEVLRHYAKWLNPNKHIIINVARRMQGLIIQKGNPKQILKIEDITKADVRFVNRQKNSGTRFLLNGLLKKSLLNAPNLLGASQIEHTHASVAAYIASNMADAGLAIETAASLYKLDFIPLVQERYFLLVNEQELSSTGIQALLKVFNAPQVREEISALSGYSLENYGKIESLKEVFTTFNLY